MLHRFVMVFTLLCLLAACGAQEPTAAPTSEIATEPTAEPVASGPIEVTDSTGATVSLAEPAQQVVACAEEALDFLVVLEIQPVGFCSNRVEGATSGQAFTTAHFFPKEALGEPLFVGTVNAPSVETVAQLNPDLILSMAYATDANAQLTQAAPTFVLDASADTYWRETLLEIAKAVGKTERAEQFLTEYDATAERLAAQLKPLAESKPNVLFIYSFGASDGTMLLGKDWAGSRPFDLFGFNVLEPAAAPFENGVAPVSPEIVGSIEDADMIFVIRPKNADGTTPQYPIDDILASLEIPVIYQEIDSTRGSTAPYTDLFVMNEIATLLGAVAP